MMRFPRLGCRYNFTTADWQFITDSLRLSERSRSGLESLADDPDAIRYLLDHPKLFEALLMGHRAAMVSPELFFLVVIRHTLKRIGVDDLDVADYMAVVCANFSIPTTKVSPQNNQVMTWFYSIDYQQALEQADSRERFFIHVECANQFMVLTCLYPSFLERRAARRGAPDVSYYEQVVVANLDAAGHHALAGEFELNEVLPRLSSAFPPVRRAMNYTLSEYLSLGR